MKKLLKELLQRILGTQAQATLDPWADTLEDDPYDSIVQRVAKRVLMKNNGFELRFIENLTKDIIEEYKSIVQQHQQGK